MLMGSNKDSQGSNYVCVLVDRPQWDMQVKQCTQYNLIVHLTRIVQKWNQMDLRHKGPFVHSLSYKWIN